MSNTGSCKPMGAEAWTRSEISIHCPDVNHILQGLSQLQRTAAFSGGLRLGTERGRGCEAVATVMCSICPGGPTEASPARAQLHFCPVLSYAFLSLTPNEQLGPGTPSQPLLLENPTCDTPKRPGPGHASPPPQPLAKTRLAWKRC